MPDGIAGSAFGPRLQAAFVTLTARHRVSRRGIVELAHDLFGVTLLTGAVDAICQRASDALAGPHLHLHDWVLDQNAVPVDETGWRTRGEGCALWTATTPDAACLQIAEHCNRAHFTALVGTEYPGIVVSDRWNGYRHLDPERRQVCWSHLHRDLRRHADGLGEQTTFGEQGVPLTKKVFAAGHASQHEHHDRARLQAEIAPVQTELRALLEAASPTLSAIAWCVKAELAARVTLGPQRVRIPMQAIRDDAVDHVESEAWRGKRPRRFREYIGSRRAGCHDPCAFAAARSSTA